MGMQGRKADLEHLVGAAPRMQHDPAAAFAMGIDEVVHLGRDARLGEGGDDEVALPGAIALKSPVLDRAAAAHAEMRTDRRDAVGARGLDPQQPAAVGMAVPALHLDGLARQRIGHVDRSVRLVGDAVAAPAELRDGEPLSHAMLR